MRIVYEVIYRVFMSMPFGMLMMIVFDMAANTDHLGNYNSMAFTVSTWPFFYIWFRPFNETVEAACSKMTMRS
jgi:hypothetical protein